VGLHQPLASPCSGALSGLRTRRPSSQSHRRRTSGRGLRRLSSPVGAVRRLRSCRGSFQPSRRSSSPVPLPYPLQRSSLAPGDTATAVRLLETSLSEPLPPGGAVEWNIAHPRAPDRLLFAQILAARGDHRRAIAVADVFDSPSPSVFLIYLPASLKLRADAAAALGDRSLAEALQSRLAALRSSSVASSGQRSSGVAGLRQTKAADSGAHFAAGRARAHFVLALSASVDRHLEVEVVHAPSGVARDCGSC
jgi:hypothetical protein